MVFRREIESSFPYTNPINLLYLQQDLLHKSPGEEEEDFWPPPMEPSKVDQWIGFIRTALITLRGQGELGYGASVDYTVKFAGTKEGENRLIFDPEGGNLHYLSLDGKTSINLYNVQSVTQIDDNTVVISGGETSITNLTVSANGQVNLSIEPTLK